MRSRRMLKMYAPGKIAWILDGKEREFRFEYGFIPRASHGKEIPMEPTGHCGSELHRRSNPVRYFSATLESHSDKSWIKTICFPV